MDENFIHMSQIIQFTCPSDSMFYLFLAVHSNHSLSTLMDTQQMSLQWQIGKNVLNTMVWTNILHIVGTQKIFKCFYPFLLRQITWLADILISSHEKWDNSNSFIRLLRGLNERVHLKHLVKCLAWVKGSEMLTSIIFLVKLFLLQLNLFEAWS